MRAYLVRVGIDQAFGGWNAPIDPDTGTFVYVPIPEKAGTEFQPGLAASYDPFRQSLADCFGLSLPAGLSGRQPHLDPDFGTLTYGDNGLRRGKGLCDLSRGDLVVFYAGLRPVRPCEHRLIYAIIGLYRVGDVVRLRNVPAERWAENAHTRKLKQGPDDVIIRATPGTSGRLERAIPIGEFRDRAYRVRRDLLTAWGGLSCRDGFIQRSAVPPTFRDPARFVAWYEGQAPRLIAANNETPVHAASSRSITPVANARRVIPVPAVIPSPQIANMAAPVILVHLRQPKRSDANESRTDPLYEFGSFGTTDCHNTNLLRDTAATGARFGFIQPGPGIMRLMFLTPPVTVIDHGKRRGAHWKPAEMPLRFAAGIVLIDQEGNTDVPSLKAMLTGGQRSTWVGRFSSAFRSRTTPLPAHVATELIAAWDRLLVDGGPAIRAERYWEALPFMPPRPDTNRAETHRRLLAMARGGPSSLRCTRRVTAARQVTTSRASAKRRGNCRS